MPRYREEQYREGAIQLHARLHRHCRRSSQEADDVHTITYPLEENSVNKYPLEETCVNKYPLEENSVNKSILLRTLSSRKPRGDDAARREICEEMKPRGDDAARERCREETMPRGDNAARRRSREKDIYRYLPPSGGDDEM